MGLEALSWIFDEFEENENDPVYELTEEDAQELLDIGVSEDDIYQIKQVAKIVKLGYDWNYENGTSEGGPISASEAIGIIGKHKFLCGLDRCAFHWTATQSNDDGTVVIYYDASEYFK